MLRSVRQVRHLSNRFGIGGTSLRSLPLRTPTTFLARLPLCASRRVLPRRHIGSPSGGIPPKWDRSSVWDDLKETIYGEEPPVKSVLFVGTLVGAGISIYNGYDQPELIFLSGIAGAIGAMIFLAIPSIVLTFVAAFLVVYAGLWMSKK